MRQQVNGILRTLLATALLVLVGQTGAAQQASPQVVPPSPPSPPSKTKADSPKTQPTKTDSKTVAKDKQKADQQKTASKSKVGEKQTAGKSSAKKTAKKKRYAWLVEHPVIQKLLKLHNEERARWGIEPLRLNPEMCLAAQQHAEWMAQTGYYQHSNLPWAEIIFMGPLTPEDAVSGWIASPPHYSVMLSGTEAGFGYAVRDGVTYWVGVFR